MFLCDVERLLLLLYKKKKQQHSKSDGTDRFKWHEEPLCIEISDFTHRVQQHQEEEESKEAEQHFNSEVSS